MNDGNVRCWGSRTGDLGYGHSNHIGDNEDPLTQGDLDVGEKVLKLGLGNDFTCALLESQNVKCWGSNSMGQLGLGYELSTVRRIPSFYGPIDFGTTVPVVDIAVGWWHACAVFETGQIKCWGKNEFGQLGYGHTQNIGDGERPGEVGFVEVGERVISLSLGRDHTCALLGGGQVKCWGNNNYGQLGLGHRDTIGDSEVPSSILGISLGGEAVELASGSGFSCVRLTTGDVKCWGHNYFSQLGLGHREQIGDNETPDSADPVQLGHPASQVVSGENFSCSLLDGGKVRCWGGNYYGQLGLGHRRTIGDDEHPSSQAFPELPEEVIQLASGGRQACALFKSGRLTCWGYNREGQLGLGHNRHVGGMEHCEMFPMWLWRECLSYLSQI